MKSNIVLRYFSRLLGLAAMGGAIIYPWFWLPSIIRAIHVHGLLNPRVIGALIAFSIIEIGGILLGYVVVKIFIVKRKEETNLKH